MGADGEMTVRGLAADEFEGLSRGLREKCRVAVWRPPDGIRESQSVRFLVLPTHLGRRFYVSPPLSGWSSLREAVIHVAMMGYWWLRADEARPSTDDLDLDAAELFLHFVLMPRKQQFRARQYKRLVDFLGSARQKISLLPEQLLSAAGSSDGADRKKPKIKLTASAHSALKGAAEQVFGDVKTDFLTMLALWHAEAFAEDRPRPWRRERLWKAVVRSVLAVDITANAVRRARDSAAAKLLMAHVTRVSSDDNRELQRVFTRIQRQGFREIWASKAARKRIKRREFERDMLCLMADSFWTVSRCWCRVMGAVRQAIRPALSPMEGQMFDRLYLPQDYLAELAPLVLWPRMAIVWPLTAKFLEICEEESWRFNAIPFCLKVYAEMDDETRLHDRRRKRHKGREVQFEKPEDLIQPSSAAATEADLERLRELFHRQKESGPLSCPKCDRNVENIDFTNDPESGEQRVKLTPCGCVFPVSS